MREHLLRQGVHGAWTNALPRQGLWCPCMNTLAHEMGAGTYINTLPRRRGLGPIGEHPLKMRGGVEHV